MERGCREDEKRNQDRARERGWRVRGRTKRPTRRNKDARARKCSAQRQRQRKTRSVSNAREKKWTCAAVNEGRGGRAQEEEGKERKQRRGWEGICVSMSATGRSRRDGSRRVFWFLCKFSLDLSALSLTQKKKNTRNFRRDVCPFLCSSLLVRDLLFAPQSLHAYSVSGFRLAGTDVCLLGATSDLFSSVLPSLSTPEQNRKKHHWQSNIQKGQGSLGFR